MKNLSCQKASPLHVKFAPSPSPVTGHFKFITNSNTLQANHSPVVIVLWLSPIQVFVLVMSPKFTGNNSNNVIKSDDNLFELEKK